MAPPRDSRIPAAPELEDAEARARQALGIQDRPVSRPIPPPRSGQPRPRHRFVQDGEVPVVVLHNTPKAADAAPANRIRAAEDALEAERASHAETARALRDAEAAVQALETKLAHAELAHTEALAAEREARERAEQALRDALAAAAPAMTGMADAPLAPAADKPRRGRPRKVVEPIEAIAADKPRRGRPRLNAAPSAPKQREPKPVKWWLPKRPTRGKA